MIRVISHPTDFSPEGHMAFLHALRLAQLHRCRLDLLHVRQPHQPDQFARFPHVREVLVRWGAMKPDAGAEDITAETGIEVRKVEITDRDAVDGLSTFLLGHRPDLLVMATHGPTGLNSWVSGSVSAAVAEATRIPTLLFGPLAEPFLNTDDGTLLLNRVLIPVAEDPPVGRALLPLREIVDTLPVTLDFITIGEDVPTLVDADGEPLKIRSLGGEVVPGILHEAATGGAGLIAMATAGKQGFLDFLHGSTTEQVVRQALRPVLAVPV